MNLPRVEELIPHRPPFLFVDHAHHVSDTEGSFYLRLAGDDPRLQQGELQPLFLLEALAQSTAAFNGIHGKREVPDATESGVLVQIDKATLHARARAGDDIVLRVREVRRFGALVIFDGTAQCGDRILAEARLTVRRDHA